VIYATQILCGARGVVVEETVKHAVLRSVVVARREYPGLIGLLMTGKESWSRLR
jgi:hypothetical protein